MSQAASKGPAASPAAAAAKAKANPAFLSEVRAAHFFYLDDFILLAVGNKLHLYRWGGVRG